MNIAMVDNAINFIARKNLCNNHYTMFTNLLGVISFDLAMLSSSCNIPKTFMYVPTRGIWYCVISIEDKHGLYKAYYNIKSNEFTMKKGTIELFKFNSFNENIFKRIINERNTSSK